MGERSVISLCKIDAIQIEDSLRIVHLYSLAEERGLIEDECYDHFHGVVGHDAD